mmetsp:Transcript_75923/g.197996  ORF Transcript_75923/g.197996 Transcript_75923/m.197996 type:complete len:284 (-) Transcript_75923:460-1311(-)
MGDVPRAGGCPERVRPWHQTPSAGAWSSRGYGEDNGCPELCNEIFGVPPHRAQVQVLFVAGVPRDVPHHHVVLFSARHAPETRFFGRSVEHVRCWRAHARRLQDRHQRAPAQRSVPDVHRLVPFGRDNDPLLCRSRHAVSVQADPDAGNRRSRIQSEVPAPGHHREHHWWAPAHGVDLDRPLGILREAQAQDALGSHPAKQQDRCLRGGRLYPARAGGGTSPAHQAGLGRPLEPNHGLRVHAAEPARAPRRQAPAGVGHGGGGALPEDAPAWTLRRQVPGAVH